SQHLPEILSVEDSPVIRRNKRKAPDMTVGVRETGEWQSDDREMRCARRTSAGSMAADHLGDLGSKANPLITTQERIPYRLRDKGGCANVRHFTVDMFENQPAFAESIGSSLTDFW